MNDNEAAQLNTQGYAFDQSGDKRKAIECFQKIVDNAEPSSAVHLVATYNLACKLYEVGETDIGRQLFMQAAEKGHAGANYYMGVILERENDIAALNYYRRAAEQGHAKAIEVLMSFFGH